jgi:hypothetical protein
MKELSRAVNYDISFLYRIRSGKRRPHDLDEFIRRICSYTVLNRKSEGDLELLGELTGVSPSLLTSEKQRHQALVDYLTHNGSLSQNTVDDFLRKVDSFDLRDYSAGFPLDTSKLDSVPLPAAPRQMYYGTEQMRLGNLAFFRHAVQSYSQEDLFMCTDMPMLDMAADERFAPQFVLSVAAVLEKGLHLNIIHELNRPLREMLLALESWIPLYMTGRISPYYLPKKGSELYHHLLFTCGTAALSGECIAGKHDHGRYELTTDPQELSYFKTRSKDLLKKAKPLMDIYGVDQWDAFYRFARDSQQLPGDRRGILCRPPMHTMPEALLQEILDSNQVSEQQREPIWEHFRLEHEALEEMTETHHLEDRFSVLSEEEFREHPVAVSAPLCYGILSYTWEQYSAHVEATLNTRRPNYRAMAMAPAFRHIDAYIVKGSHAVICKHNEPGIQFVIRHPKLVSALENYVVVLDQD